MKRQSTEWEIFASYISNLNLQGAQKTKLPKNQWPNEEMAKWTE
jgi:hypothetical protein